MNAAFNDHFGSVASAYADCRPGYPPELFAWLAAQCGRCDCAWDCGAGSGQASLALAEHFNVVHATDASAGQIACAASHPHVTYTVVPAEASGLASQSVDLVTVAQALHWFDLPAFYAEVRRVLRPNGLFAAWTYGVLHVTGTDVDDQVQRFYSQDVGSYWPPERLHVENGYRDLLFPFDPLDPPAFVMQVEWSLSQLLGYFRSWSASARYAAATGCDAVTALEARLLEVWGAPDVTRRVTWPLSVRVGRPVAFTV